MFDIISPNTACLPWPIVKGPVGLQLTNSTFAVCFLVLGFPKELLSDKI